MYSDCFATSIVLFITFVEGEHRLCFTLGVIFVSVRGGIMKREKGGLKIHIVCVS